MLVEWTVAASGDLDSIYAFVAEDDVDAASRQIFKVIEIAESLLPENPGLGRPGRAPFTRELIIPRTPYLVVYRVSGGILQILRVLHSARKWPGEI